MKVLPEDFGFFACMAGLADLAGVLPTALPTALEKGLFPARAVLVALAGALRAGLPVVGFFLALACFTGFLLETFFAI
jgi:hypothetical protein